MPRLTKQQHLEIIEKYNSGALCSELATEYGVDRTSVSSLLDRKGILKHQASYVYRRASGHFLNENAFDAITPESAYWMGFLMADGAIVDTIVALQLSLQDVNHLEKFKSFVQGTQAILNIESSCAVRYAFQSAKIASALAFHGIGERKSFYAEASEILAMNKDFWRGVVDGDGSLGIYLHRNKHVPRFDLSGSSYLTTQFCNYINALGIKALPEPSKNIYRVQLSGNKAIAVVNHLYQGAGVYLDRKALKAYQINEWCAGDFPSCIG